MLRQRLELLNRSYLKILRLNIAHANVLIENKQTYQEMQGISVGLLCPANRDRDIT